MRRRCRLGERTTNRSSRHYLYALDRVLLRAPFIQREMRRRESTLRVDKRGDQLSRIAAGNFLPLEQRDSGRIFERLANVFRPITPRRHVLSRDWHVAC